MDKKENPPHSRIFISGSFCTNEEIFRNEYQKFGKIECIQFIRHKDTGKSKGVAYITFSKASEAALAMEATNGENILESIKPLNVKIAQDKTESNISKNANEDDRIMRLFIKTFGEDEDSIRRHFSQYGKIKKIVMLKQKKGNRGKGFAFVKFYKASDAAKAIEECDPIYKAIFGKLQDTQVTEKILNKTKHGNDNLSNMRSNSKFHHNYQQLDYNDHHNHPVAPINNYSNMGCEDVHNCLFDFPVSINPLSVRQLFNIIPGLQSCMPQMESNNTVFNIMYNSQIAATYALEKLQNFEYPPSMPIFIACDPFNATMNTNIMSNMMNCMNMMMGMGGKFNDSAQSFSNNILASTSGPPYSSFHTLNKTNDISNNQYSSYCNVKLPAPEPMADKSAQTVERLWVMGYPKIPPIPALLDTFGRFGNLITVVPSKDRNYCYVHYANSKSAWFALKTLDKSTICQMEMKVVIADPPDKQLKRDSFKNKGDNQNNANTNNESSHYQHLHAGRKRLRADNE
ncbi:unnamed protein product [Gordionus sp. m RMFG-2023]